MNRRSFLRFLGVGVAAAVVAPMAVKAVVPFEFDKIIESTQCQEPITASIGEYADYASFSDFQIASAIDASVNEAAAQLGYRAR